MANKIIFEDSNKANFYLKHKEYFDDKIIKIMQTQHQQHIRDKELLLIYNATIAKLKKELFNEKFKNKDLTIALSNLKVSEKNKDKELEEKVEIITNIVNGELQDAYNENERLRSRVEKMEELYEKEKKKNEILEKEMDILKMNNKVDSTNSSLPPSRDFGDSRKISNNKSNDNDTEETPDNETPNKKPAKKRGGVPGHTAHRSTVTKEPDEIINIEVDKIPSGAIKVCDDEGNYLYSITQNIDVVLKPFIYETRYYLNTENGISLDVETMKKYAINPVTYSTGFKAMTLYLNSKGAIALKRLTLMIKELTRGNVNLSPSTIVKWQKQFTNKSESFRASILDDILSSSVVHTDETGWKVNGKNQWLHVVTSKNGAYFVTTEKRSDEETGPLKTLEEFTGFLVHDHFKPYYRLENCIHVECNVHILRYLQKGIDIYASAGCLLLKELFKEIYKRKQELIEAGENQMAKSEIEEYEKRYLEIIENTLKSYELENPEAKTKYQPDYIPTMKRLKKFINEHLMFIKSFDAPFHNNAAETMLRQAKAKKKISGQSYTTDTANDYAAIHTVNQTCMIRNENTLETIEDILK